MGSQPVAEPALVLLDSEAMKPVPVQPAGLTSPRDGPQRRLQWQRALARRLLPPRRGRGERGRADPGLRPGVGPRRPRRRTSSGGAPLAGRCVAPDPGQRRRVDDLQRYTACGIPGARPTGSTATPAVAPRRGGELLRLPHGPQPRRSVVGRAGRREVDRRGGSGGARHPQRSGGGSFHGRRFRGLLPRRTLAGRGRRRGPRRSQPGGGARARSSVASRGWSRRSSSRRTAPPCTTRVPWDRELGHRG